MKDGLRKTLSFYPIHLFPSAAINKIVLLGDKIISASDDGTIGIWSRRDMEDRIRWYSGSSADVTGSLRYFLSGGVVERHCLLVRGLITVGREAICFYFLILKIILQ